MWSVPPALQFVAQFIPVQNFLLERGPLLFTSILGTLFLGICYWLLIETLRQRWYKLHWMYQNRNAVRQVLILNFMLKRIKPKLPKCSACSHDEMEFWNCGDELLVFQCSNCRRNQTLTSAQWPEARIVLNNLPGLMLVLSRLNKAPYDALGKHLQTLCTSCELFARRYLQRVPELKALKVTHSERTEAKRRAIALAPKKVLADLELEKRVLPEVIKRRKRTRQKVRPKALAESF